MHVVKQMAQIGYFSTAVGQQAATTVHDILTVARRTNRQLGITGLLVAASDRYLQVIEGPKHCVGAVYSKIIADKRHMGVTQFLNKPISEPEKFRIGSDSGTYAFDAY